MKTLTDHPILVMLSQRFLNQGMTMMLASLSLPELSTPGQNDYVVGETTLEKTVSNRRRRNESDRMQIVTFRGFSMGPE